MPSHHRKLELSYKRQLASSGDTIFGADPTGKARRLLTSAFPACIGTKHQPGQRESKGYHQTCQRHQS
jgi:hypothetical protein